MNVAQQLRAAPVKEARLLEDAIYTQNMSLSDAERYVRQEVPDFSLADWVQGKGRYAAHGPGYGSSSYTTEQVLQSMTEAQQEASTHAWKSGDRAEARRIRRMEPEDYAREGLGTENPWFNTTEPLNLQLQKDFELADRRFKFEGLEDIYKTDAQLEMEMNTQLTDQLWEHRVRLQNSIGDENYEIGDDVLGAEAYDAFTPNANLVDVDRVWDEVDQQINDLLIERVQLYRELESVVGDSARTLRHYSKPMHLRRLPVHTSSICSQWISKNRRGKSRVCTTTTHKATTMTFETSSMT